MPLAVLLHAAAQPCGACRPRQLGPGRLLSAAVPSAVAVRKRVNGRHNPLDCRDEAAKQVVNAVVRSQQPVCRAADALELGVKGMHMALTAYRDALQAHPLLVSAATAFVGCVVGDMMTQFVEASAAGAAPALASLDVTRTLHLGAYGGLEGALASFWYSGLEYLLPEGSAQDEVDHGACTGSFRQSAPGEPVALALSPVWSKFALEQLVWLPATTLLFFVVMALLEGQPQMVGSMLHALRIHTWPVLAWCNPHARWCVHSCFCGA